MRPLFPGRLVLAGLLPLVAACGDGTAPRPLPVTAALSLDQAVLDTAIARVRDVTEQAQLGTSSTMFLSSRRLALFVDFEGRPFPALLRASVDASQGAPDAPGAPGAQFSPPLLAPALLPDSLKGRTYLERSMLSSNTRWQLDTLADGRPAPGAPSDAVRIVLRANPFGLDTSRVGYAIIREPARGMLRVEVTRLDGTMVAQAEGAGRPAGFGVLAQGSATRGARTITHRRTSAGTSTRTTVEDLWALSFPGLEARGELRLARTARAGEERHVLTLGGRGYTLRVAGEPLELELSVLVGDSLFAKRTHSMLSSVAGPGPWVAARGSDLTAAERQALEGLVGLALSLYDAEQMVMRANFWLTGLRGDFLFP